MTSASAHQNGEGEGARRADEGAREDLSEPAAPEAYGPLALARHVKGDGRTLIVYTLRPRTNT